MATMLTLSLVFCGASPLDTVESCGVAIPVLSMWFLVASGLFVENDVVVPCVVADIR